MIRQNYELIIAQRAVRKGTSPVYMGAYMARKNYILTLDGKSIKVYGKKLLAHMYEALAKQASASA